MSGEFAFILIAVIVIAWVYAMELGEVLNKLKDIERELKKLNRTPPTFGQYPEKDIKAVLDDSMTWRVDYGDKKTTD